MNIAIGKIILYERIRSIKELFIPISSENKFVKNNIINISKNIKRFKTIAKDRILNFLFFVLVSLDTINRSEIKVFILVNIVPYKLTF